MSNPEAAVREYPSVLAVARGYGLDVTNYAAGPGGYLLDAAAGKYWLKPFAGSEKELSYVIAASEHLTRRGFPYHTHCLRLRDGSPGIRFRRVLFYLVEAAPGPEPRLASLEDLNAAGARLGWFHLAARGFIPPDEVADIRSEWGSCERVFKEHLLDLYDFQETCTDRPRRTRFDLLYLEHFNDFIDEAREAVDLVADLPLGQMIALAREERQFCHGDFTPSAMSVDAQGELVITDFEMARSDLRSMDIAELIRATSEFNADRAEAVLQGYHASFPLTQEDVRLVEAYLRFPRDYWRAANAYYREGINARARLSEAVANYESGRRFLSSFRHFCEKFRAGSAYVGSEAESRLYEAPDGFFPPAAFSPGSGAGMSDEDVPAADGSSYEEEAQPESIAANELGDLPYPPMGTAGQAGDTAESPLEAPVADDAVPAPQTGRKRALPDRCLFDEPLPPRRRGSDVPFWAPAPEPAEVIPPPEDIRAPEYPPAPEPVDERPGAATPAEPLLEEPPVADFLQEAIHPEVTQPEPMDQDVLPEPADVRRETAAPAQAGEAGERKKIVWKFPAPMAKQEDKE